MMSNVTNNYLSTNHSVKTIAYGKSPGETSRDEVISDPVCCSNAGPDPVALALSGIVVTLLLLCLCCLCKFRWKTSPTANSNEMTPPTVVVTQRTYIHSTSMDQPPPYTPPPEFPGVVGNVGLWPPTMLKYPDTPPPPYSVTISRTTHHVVPSRTLSTPA